MEALKKDPRQKQIQELDELAKKYRADAVEYDTEADRLKVSLANEEKITASRINEIQTSSVLDKSSKSLVNDILQLPVGKSQQLKDNIAKLAIASKGAKQKAVLHETAKAKVLAEIREEEIDALSITAFNETEKVFEFYKVANNHFYNVAVPAIDRAYEADPGFCDINKRVMRLGLHKLIAHTITNTLKKDGTRAVSLEAVVKHVRHNFDSEGIENMILPRIYDKTEDVDPYREEF